MGKSTTTSRTDVALHDRGAESSTMSCYNVINTRAGTVVDTPLLVHQCTKTEWQFPAM
eukprot:jgi/Botrbrau1/14624/Bobra.0364s0008.1